MADTEMRDADAIDEEERQYGQGLQQQENLDEKYPNRPHNHSKSLLFHELFLSLFNPLNENKKKPAGPAVWRRRQGPNASTQLSPHEIRRNIIERFISRWRKEVGNDIYPAFRLILPEKDRERPMYGLKEKTIGKLLVRVLRIDKHSEDAVNLLNWKLPGQKVTSVMAGDFGGRCYEVISKRPIRTAVGTMTIADVNEKLDQLATSSKEDEHLPIFEEFYQRMNPDELMWLIRMVLRQMKIGATEKTIFELWHPDADSLFNVSSSLRRVCWELYDPHIRLEGSDCGITLMQCFQPQLAAFQMHSFEKMVSKMRPDENDDTFWIEEKLDGERMQLHLVEDDSIPGGKRFNFWSRKAKDYTYLYGEGFNDENSALTRHLKAAFSEGVRNIILDGEMITWDLEQNAMVPFGTLKTAALSEQRNPFSTGQRPLLRVFDCLYLNDEPLTSYTLRDRRKALEASISPIHRRLEIHGYKTGRSATDIEPILRQVVAEASEGLVLKNPRSMYRLNERNDDWIKVKPEYMTEFGEALDCVIIGGYYGSGHRGGRLSSFLCGLRVNEKQIRQGANPLKCYSFFKVGGGLTAADYGNIRHHTDGKWHTWNPRSPPSDYVELAGGDKQYERPDVWIRPDESVVVSVKAASVGTTDQFRMGITLRFPRFKKLRLDKDWKSALSIQEFLHLKDNVEQERQEKKFQVDDSRRKRLRTTKKKPIVVAGSEDQPQSPYGGPATKVLAGLTFYIMTDSQTPVKKSKGELEQLVKANGGNIVQTARAGENVICVAEKRLPRVVSLMKTAERNIIKPSWLFDCIRQSEADVGRPNVQLPYEPKHMFYLLEEDQDFVEAQIDDHGDSYARDVAADELRKIFDEMPSPHNHSSKGVENLSGVRGKRDCLGNLQDTRGWMFTGMVIYFDQTSPDQPERLQNGNSLCSIVSNIEFARRTAAFAGSRIASERHDPKVTHIIAEGRERYLELRREFSVPPIPYIITPEWVLQSWKEKTLLDEERFVPS